MKRILIIILIIFQGGITYGELPDGETRYTRKDYVNMWKLVALQKMFDHGIPASITLAQGILESGNGNSTLARKANNHFGIKCHNWGGPGYYMDDDKKDECFRVYASAEESFEDHSEFLLKNRYAGLFKLKITDYKGWAKGLKKAGYATNPQYANRLIEIIEDMQLYKLDRLSYKEFLAMGGEKEAKNKVAKEKDSTKKGTKKAKDDELEELVLIKGREVELSANKIKYVIAEQGDTYDKIANDLDLGRWQVLKYNDLEKSSKIKPGDIVYIQPKRSKASSAIHTVKQGESYRDISQLYGIKLKKLLKRNHIEHGSQPKAGQKLKLK